MNTKKKSKTTPSDAAKMMNTLNGEAGSSLVVNGKVLGSIEGDGAAVGVLVMRPMFFAGLQSGVWLEGWLEVRIRSRR